MRIQHNIAALNSYRQPSGNNSAVSKNLEVISPVTRSTAQATTQQVCNLRKDESTITGLETAQKNANDGISSYRPQKAH